MVEIVGIGAVSESFRSISEEIGLKVLMTATELFNWTCAVSTVVAE